MTAALLWPTALAPATPSALLARSPVVAMLLWFAALATAAPPALPACDSMPTTIALPLPSPEFYMPENMTYLNVGSLGPSPRAVVECASEQWKWLESDKVSNYPWSGGVPEAVRSLAAAMLGSNISLDELAHFPSTTTALNAVVNGLVSSGFLNAANWSGTPPRVLTTDQEHGGGVAAWQHYVHTGKLSGLDTVGLGAPPRSVDDVVNAFQQSFEAHPNGTYAVLFVSHVLTTTGLRLPIARLASLAHAYKALLVVDGAQAPGNIPVQMDISGADAYTVSAHKWLLAPTGSGLLYVRHAARPFIQPVYLDCGFSSYTACTGTVPLQTMAGFGYALTYLSLLGGLPALGAHNAKLYSLTHGLLLNEPRIRLLSPAPGSGLESALLSFTIVCAGATNAAVYQQLAEEYAIVVKLLPDGEGGTPLVKNALRISHHAFNSEAQINGFASALSVVLDAQCDA